MAKKHYKNLQEGVSVLIPTLGNFYFYDFKKLIKKLISEDLIFLKIKFEILIIFNQEEQTLIYKKLQKEYKLDSNIKIYHESKKGIVNALNTGIKHSNYSLIARQDDDDKSLPLRIKKTIDFLIKGNYDLAFTKSILIKNKSIKYWDKEVNNRLKIQLLFYNPFVHATMIIKKELILKVNGYKFRNGAEDHELFLRLAYDDAKFGLLKEYLYEYNLDNSIRGNGVKRSFTNYIRSLKLIFSNCFRFKIRIYALIALIPSFIFQTCVLTKNLFKLN